MPKSDERDKKLQDWYQSVYDYISSCFGRDSLYTDDIKTKLGIIEKWKKQGIIFSGDKAPNVIKPNEKDLAIAAMHKMIQEIRAAAVKSVSKGLTWGQVHADLLQAIETDLARVQEDLARGQEAKAGSGFKDGLIHPRLNYEGACGKGKKGLQNVTFSQLGVAGIMMKVAHPGRGNIQTKKEAILGMEEAIIKGVKGDPVNDTPIDPELKEAFQNMAAKRKMLWPENIRKAVGEKLKNGNSSLYQKDSFDPKNVWFDTRTLDPYSNFGSKKQHRYAQRFGKSYGIRSYLLRLRGFFKSGSEGNKTLKLLKQSENDPEFISFESPSHPSWSYKGYEGKGVKSKMLSTDWGISRGLYQGHPGFKRLQDIAEAYHSVGSKDQEKNQAFDVLYPIMRGGRAWRLICIVFRCQVFMQIYWRLLCV